MCKAIKRPEMIKELVELKATLDSAKAEYDAKCNEVIANLKSSGLTKDEVEHVAKVAIVVRTKADTETLNTIEEWTAIKAEEKLLAETRKTIEKEHRVDGEPFIKLTILA